MRLQIICSVISIIFSTSLLGQTPKRITIYLDDTKILKTNSITDSNIDSLRDLIHIGVAQGLLEQEKVLRYELVNQIELADYVAQASINYGDWPNQKLPPMFFHQKYSVALLLYDRISKDTIDGRVLTLESLQKTGNLVSNVAEKFGFELLPNACIVPTDILVKPDNSGDRNISLFIDSPTFDEELESIAKGIEKVTFNIFSYYTNEKNYFDGRPLYLYKVLNTSVNPDFKLKIGISKENIDKIMLTFTLIALSAEALSIQAGNVEIYQELSLSKLSNGNYSEYMRAITPELFMKIVNPILR